MSYFLFGYNGLGNIGDDLMHESLVVKLPKEKIKFSYLKNYQTKDEVQCQGVKLIYRMLVSKKFFIVGGNVFSYERPKSYLKIIYYLMIFSFRRLLGKENIIVSVGLDLKEGKFWRQLVLSAINFCDSVSIRDNLSYRYMRRNIKNNAINILFEYDRVFREKDYIRSLSCKLDNNPFGKYLLWWVSYPAFIKNSNSENLSNKYKEKLMMYENVVFFCQGDKDKDRALNIIKDLKICNYIIYNYNYNKLQEAINIISSASFVVTERYHGAILAEVFQTRWTPIAFSEKLSRVRPNSNKSNEILQN